MINKFVLTHKQNTNFVKENLGDFLANALALSRYEENDPLRAIAEANFRKAFDYILTHPEVENDYHCLIDLHTLLMQDLDNGIRAELSTEQISELSEMINQPAKANTEIAIDVMLYILDKRLFADGDVRVALMFANKIMIDNGCGFITVSPFKKEEFRTMLHNYKEQKSSDLKEWIWRYCIKGVKTEY